MKNKKIIILISVIIIIAIAIFIILGSGKKEENKSQENEQKNIENIEEKQENRKDNNNENKEIEGEKNKENNNEWTRVEGLQTPEMETDNYSILNFGIRNNIFVEDVLEYGNKEFKNAEEVKKIKEYLITLSNKTKNELTSNENEGIMYQRVFYMYKDDDLKCYILGIEESKVICDIDYFKNNAFEDYKKMKNNSSEEDEYAIFTNDLQEEYPKLNIEYNGFEETEDLYFTLDGNYLGNNYDEIKKVLGITDDEEIIEDEPQDEEVDDEQGVEIIEEEDSEEEGIVDEEDVPVDVEIVEIESTDDDTDDDNEEIIEEDEDGDE